MEKEFVSADIAAKLKELGFNEECLRCIGADGKLFRYAVNGEQYETNQNSELPYWAISAPLWQQAEKYIFDTYNLFINIYPIYFNSGDIQWSFEISQEGESKWKANGFKIGMLEAREAAIIKALSLIKQQTL